MLRGIYSSASGMIMEMDKVSMFASNISNAQSAGFKKRDMNAIPFQELMINVLNGSAQKIGKRKVDSINVPIGTGAGTTFQEVDNTQGSLKPTSRALDFAIDGNGWFTMQRKVDNLVYTSKNGNFLLNEKGEIITGEGDHLLDKAGKFITIEVPTNNTKFRNSDLKAKSLEERLTLKENGDLFDGPNKIATLRIQTDTNKMSYIPQLKLAVYDQIDAQVGKNTNGGTSLIDNEGKSISVRQGFIEQSNVSIISEMIGLIHASKNYESGHKLIMAEDKILDKAINELGRTG